MQRSHFRSPSFPKHREQLTILEAGRMYPIFTNFKETDFASLFLAPSQKLFQYSIPGLHSSSKPFPHDSAQILSSSSWGWSPAAQSWKTGPEWRQSSPWEKEIKTQRGSFRALEEGRVWKWSYLPIACFVHCWVSGVWRTVHNMYVLSQWASEWKGTEACQSKAGGWQNTWTSSKPCDVLTRGGVPRKHWSILLFTLNSKTKMK